MVDLHAHSDRSDGELSPAKLVELAHQTGLRALALTDHDSIAGHDEALERAQRVGLDLIRGIEISARFRGRSIHVLGYFLNGTPNEEFRGHLSCLQKARRERNVRLAGRLRELGVGVQLEEVESLGRSQTGRPHFARVLVQKGYASDIREAFRVYLDESAPGYVHRRDASLKNVLSWIRNSGGISSWAHPGRFIRNGDPSPSILFGELASQGLDAVEVYHTDHSPQDSQEFLRVARDLDLGVTGGSDFHGPASRAVLGSLELPDSLLDNLRARAQRDALGQDSSGQQASPSSS